MARAVAHRAAASVTPEGSIARGNGEAGAAIRGTYMDKGLADPELDARPLEHKLEPCPICGARETERPNPTTAVCENRHRYPPDWRPRIHAAIDRKLAQEHRDGTGPCPHDVLVRGLWNTARAMPCELVRGHEGSCQWSGPGPFDVERGEPR